MTSVDRIQGLSGSLAVKTPCRVATTANITLSGEQTIDAVAVVDGDRVLVKNQTDTTENGIYNVSTGHWTRALDFDGANDVVDGTMVYARAGTANAELFFRVNGTEPIIPGDVAISLTPANPLATVSSFAATLLDDADAAAARSTLGTAGLAVENTFTALATFALGLTVAGAAFASRGIQDDAEAKVLTLSGSGANSVTIANSATDPTIGTSAGSLGFTPANGAVVLASGANSAIYYARNTVNPVGVTLGLDAAGHAYAWNGNSIAGISNFYLGNGHANNTGAIYIYQKGVARVIVSDVGFNFNGATASLLSSNGTTGYGGFYANGAAGTTAYYFFAIAGVETARMASSVAGMGIYTGSAVAQQFEFVHTAGANRWITAAGSNGGSPTIGTSGGPLQLSSGASAGAESYTYSLSNLAGSTPALASTTGILIGANKSAGNGDVAFFNPYYIAAISFDFRQITASGVSAPVARMLPISGGTAGLVFVQGSGTVNARIGTDAASNIIIGSGTALSTSATTNHMMIPTCAGTPTGVPVDAAPGRLPLIYDTTNNKLYAYNGAWKSTAALT